MKRFLLKAAYILIMIGLAFLLVYYIGRDIAPDLIRAFKSRDEAAMEMYLAENDNILGMMLTALLQIVQVLSVFIPSIPVQVAAGVVFGTVRGFLICYIANIVANAFIYVIYAKIHVLLNRIVPMEKESKLTRMIAASGSPTYMVAMACIIPAIPNGFIPYAAYAAKVPFKKFVFAVSVGCLPPILVLCAIGNQILTGDWFLVVFLIALSFVIAAVLTLLQGRIIRFINTHIRNRR